MTASVIHVREYGAIGDGKQIDTAAFQKALDEASMGNGIKVIVDAGSYLIGSIFLHSNTELYLAEGAKLLGVTDIKEYPQIDSRVAGIEMKWPAALVNIIGANNVKIWGPGIVDGQGEIWWNLYWGKDGLGGLRKDYDQRGLRWIADYEIQRPRLMLVYESEEIELGGFTAQQSGFWTIQVTYCQAVHIHDLIVKDNQGPSTDGIDIDSSKNILIERCRISCNDDDIVVKSGRDADGLRVNRPSENVEICNCTILSGAGITLGSEVSGGIRNINIHDNVFKNTDCGFRIKSSSMRGGFIEDITVRDLKMENVQFPFSWLMAWHPAYNTFSLPDMENIPDYWKRVAEEVPIEQQGTRVRNLNVTNVLAEISNDYKEASRAFDLQGFVEKPMENITFENVKITASEFGHIVAVKNLNLKNVEVSIQYVNNKLNDKYDQR